MKLYGQAILQEVYCKITVYSCAKSVSVGSSDTFYYCGFLVHEYVN